MRIVSRLDVTVDLLTAKAEVAEVAKAATTFGASVLIEPDPDVARSMKAHIRRHHDDWASRDAARLIFLQAQAENRTIDDVLAGVRAELVRWNAPMDRPPFDAPIGEPGEPRV